MVRQLDLARLREQTVGSDADLDAVTVNTRALIDKVLARYSGDWTTLRELMQNAADALATKVVIRFETLPSKTVPVVSNADESQQLRHVIQYHSVYRLIVSNNGKPFNDSDWGRLKRIAEGNPDETKIGAFGVGFYSVFADCDEPFIISKDRTMAFVWKGNSLFTKSTVLSPEETAHETTFLLNYRNADTPIPDLTSLCQFLSTSLTFVGIENIELWVDQWKILSLQKKQSAEPDAILPKSIESRTKERLMKVVGVIHQSTAIEASWLNVIAWKPSSSAIPVTIESSDKGPSLRSLFSRLTTSNASATSRRAARDAELASQQMIAESASLYSSATAFLRISTVNVQTSVTSTFAQELERATKKPPPKHTRLAILTSSHDEAAASKSTFSGITSEKAKELFSSVIPTKHGRVFIGFPTAQTTGFLCHISAPSIIPTVERESIDLNARYVRTWNLEMLRIAGIACRMAYHKSLTELKSKIDSESNTAGPSPSKDTINRVMGAAIHAMVQFTGVESTPSAQVGNILQESFWECSKSYIEVLSTKGVLPSNHVHVVAEPLPSFLEEIPVIPQALAGAAEPFIRCLYEKGLISDMTIKDIKTELEARALNEQQLIEFLKWTSAQLMSNALDEGTIKTLVKSTIVTLNDKSDNSNTDGSNVGQILNLGNLSTYTSGSKIPPDMPVLPTTLPFRFSKVLPPGHLTALGLEELQILPWLRFLLEGESKKSLPPQQHLSKCPEFAAQVLGILSKRWDHLSAGTRGQLVDLMATHTCMPTKLGMRRPSDAYFASIKLFEDLPTVTGLSGVRDKVLAALGVRKTIELNYVFDRLMNTSQQDGQAHWNFYDLVQYLASVREDIPPDDIKRLRFTAFCPLEGSEQNNGGGRLYKVSEVFEPKEVLRQMGLPILQWRGFYRFSSPEAKFLSFLGIKQHPSAMELVKVMVQAAALKQRPQYDLAMNYFKEYYHTNAYNKTDLAEMRTIPFLPSTAQGFPSLVAPGDCYANERAALLGYTILAPELRFYASHFGVAQDPPIIECIQHLQVNPPKTHRRAVDVFGYFAGRLTEISGQVAENLGNMKIVPIIGKDAKATTYFTTPRSCFLGNPSEYGDIFDFVDFGLEANSFLLKVGSKHEPSSLELARMIARNPSKILGRLEKNGELRYISLLRKLAENQSSIKNDKALWKELKQSACLLAYKEIPSDGDKGRSKIGHGPVSEDNSDDDEAFVRVHMLRKAADIVIVDTFNHLLMFREVIAQAPQDDTLELFYQDLGVPTLSSLIELATRMGNVQRDQTEAESLRKLVVERSKLFLHEYSQGVRHDSKWLEKSLSVVLVDSLSLTYSLKGYPVAPVREKRTVTMSQSRGKECVLYITKHPDLYEVSQWVCRVLLSRPRQHDYLALEMVLSSNLRSLRLKGYNIDRILRQREFQTKMAEEQKRKQEEERRAAEQSRIDEEYSLPPPPYENSLATPLGSRTKSKLQDESTPTPKMPGAFDGDSPGSDQSQLAVAPPAGKRSNFTNGIVSSVQDWVRGLPTPAQGMPVPSGGNVRAQPANPNASEKNVAHNLVNAIQASRAFNSNQLFSPPQTSNVEESKGSYCDSQAAQDISFATDSAAGIKVFLANHIADKKGVLEKHMGAINTFGFLLLDVSSVFNIAPQALHIFYDTQGATIAFNSSGSLFFNFHWFEQLHLPNFGTSRDAQIHAVAYYFVVCAHELAHNLVKEHSAQHSFYTESFTQQYFSKAMAKALQY